MRVRGTTHRAVLGITVVVVIYNVSFLFLSRPRDDIADRTLTVADDNQHVFLKEEKTIVSGENDDQMVVIPGNHKRQKIKYIVPLGIIGGGPNYVYKHIKVAARFAISLNRSLVLVPIPRHRSELLVPFEDTFDVEEIAKITQVSDLEEFKRKCNNRIETVLIGVRDTPGPPSVTRMEQVYLKIRKHFHVLFGIEFPDVNTLPKTVEEARLRLESSGEACMGIFTSYTFNRHDEVLRLLGVPVEVTKELAQSVNQHLKRTHAVTRVADAVKNSVCGGRPYLALHWRNKTGEQCHTRRNDSKVNTENCQRFLSSLTRAGDQFASDILQIMNMHNLTCIYVAYLPYSEEIIEILSRRISDISTAADILRTESTQDASEVLSDEYFLSLLEQEICYRADVFIGSAWSNWANFVALEYEAENRPVYYLHGVRGSLADEVANITIVKDDDAVPRP